jgi:hypothetical protein
MRPGDVLADRYRLVDLLNDNHGARFWRATDTVLARHVAIHLVALEDERAEALRDAARRSATIHDPHLLRVLDTNTIDGLCYVVNEWGEGISLNHMIVDGPLTPRRAAWLVSEVGDMIATAHANGVAHGRLVPENVLVDEAGAVKVIGFAVDAALHGLPAGRESTDVVDLAGLLYTALTAKWPGVSTSNVPAAPQEHGHPLRPRQVRAGIPRVLDALCEEVLSPYAATHPQGYTSARRIADALLEYVGDPASVAEAEAARMRGSTSPRIPRIEPTMIGLAETDMPAVATAPTAEPEVPDVRDDLPEDVPTAAEVISTVEVEGPEPAETSLMPQVPDESGPVSTPATVPVPPPSPPPSSPVPPADETQAGVPVFYDVIDDVGWMTSDAEPAPPPPPFEEHPAKPLFAPDPPEGRPARTARPAAGEDAGSGSYWPWDTAAPPAIRPEPEPDPGPVPGRSWLRIAGILIACLLVLVALVYTFNRGGGGFLGVDDPGPSSSPTAQSLREVKVAAASDFDPFGSPPEENPEEAPNVVDGDPATTWHTLTYKQNFGPGGLKPGIGVLLDLGKSTSVQQVDVKLVGSPTSVELRSAAGDQPPTNIDALDVVAKGTATGETLELKLDEAVETRYLVVWLTSIPGAGGGFRGEIAEVVVRG